MLKEPDLSYYIFPEPAKEEIHKKYQRLVNEGFQLFTMYMCTIGFSLFERLWNLGEKENSKAWDFNTAPWLPKQVKENLLEGAELNLFFKHRLLLFFDSTIKRNDKIITIGLLWVKNRLLRRYFHEGI